MSDPPQLTLELASCIDELSRLVEAVNCFASDAALPPSSRYQLQLILEELFVNFVTHGRSPQGRMIIRVDDTGACLHLLTSDDGVPFNPLLAAPADTTSPLAQRPIGGLGIHLMRQYGDSLSYEYENERNIVRMQLQRGD